MHPAGPRVVLCVIIALVLGAGLLLAVGNQDGDAGEYQELVGGLGFGPAVDLGRCPCGFDPRLGGRCAEDYGPIPGGEAFCPRHLWSRGTESQ